MSIYESYPEFRRAYPAPDATYCESCVEAAGDYVLATTRSTSAEWSGYRLCQECADEYDHDITGGN